MDGFAIRTGLRGDDDGDISRRYLWTDALAVQSLLGLAEVLHTDAYGDEAVELAEATHEILGRFAESDSRSGWISGLSEEEGRQRPTVAGLRIGKELPERREGEPFDESLEWQRDGQYFHYLTRWVAALLGLAETKESAEYTRFAMDMMLAGASFVDKSGGRPRMWWKMSIDLRRPLVPTQGAHDPLEGLLCAMSVREEASKEGSASLDLLIEDLERLCDGRSWATGDPLGIGGLLINATRARKLEARGVELPEGVRSSELFGDALDSLERRAGLGSLTSASLQRLPFRECGMSLGLRVAYGHAKGAVGNDDTVLARALGRFIRDAEEIESFWRESENRNLRAWRDHLDINEVTLAASLVAAEAPGVFG